MSLFRFFLEKGLFTAFFFAVFYLIGEVWGITPQPIKDCVKWFSDNFYILAMVLVAVLFFYTINRVSKRESESYE